MASYDLTIGGSGTKLPEKNRGGFFMLGYDLKFADNNAGAADVLNLLYLPDDVLVLAVRADIITLEGAACNIDVGLYQADDGTTAIDADCFFDALDLNSATGDSCSAPGVLAEAAPNTYSPTGAQGYYTGQAAYFSVLANSAATDTARVKFYVACIQLTLDEIENSDNVNSLL